jgi:hypothetical protein
MRNSPLWICAIWCTAESCAAPLRSTRRPLCTKSVRPFGSIAQSRFNSVRKVACFGNLRTWDNVCELRPRRFGKNVVVGAPAPRTSTALSWVLWSLAPSLKFPPQPNSLRSRRKAHALPPPVREGHPSMFSCGATRCFAEEKTLFHDGRKWHLLEECRILECFYHRQKIFVTALMSHVSNIPCFRLSSDDCRLVPTQEVHDNLHNMMHVE